MISTSLPAGSSTIFDRGPALGGICAPPEGLSAWAWSVCGKHDHPKQEGTFRVFGGDLLRCCYSDPGVRRSRRTGDVCRTHPGRDRGALGAPSLPPCRPRTDYMKSNVTFARSWW